MVQSLPAVPRCRLPSRAGTLPDPRGIATFAPPLWPVTKRPVSYRRSPQSSQRFRRPTVAAGRHAPPFVDPIVDGGGGAARGAVRDPGHRVFGRRHDPLRGIQPSSSCLKAAIARSNALNHSSERLRTSAIFGFLPPTTTRHVQGLPSFFTVAPGTSPATASR